MHFTFYFLILTKLAFNLMFAKIYLFIKPGS